MLRQSAAPLAGYRSAARALPILLALVGSAVGADPGIRFVSWGGAYSHSQQKAYIDSWQGTGVEMLVYDGTSEEIRHQAVTGEDHWDIVDVLPHIARLGCDRGWFARLDRGRFAPAADGTAMDDDVMALIPNDCVVPLVFWSYVVFYRSGTFGAGQPRKIADFFDTDRFPGKRALHDWPNATIEMALVADGVPIKDVYKVMSEPAGIDRAFAMLDRIRGEAVFWTRGHEPVGLVESGRVAMSTGFNGRIGSAVLVDNSPLEVIWDGQVLEENWAVLMNNAPNPEPALEFLAHLSAPRQLAAQARYITYGPMRASAFEIIRQGEPWFFNGREVMPHLPNRPEVTPRSVIALPQWWAENGTEIERRYRAWMADIRAQ